MRSKLSFLSVSAAALLFTVSLAAASDNQADGSASEKASTESVYNNTMLTEAKKQEIEQYRKQLVYESGRECGKLEKGTPLFLKAENCPELFEKSN